MAILLSAQDLTKSFGPRPLFRGISLGVSDGERIGLIGPNGSGKSTLLRILAGLENPDSGSLSRRSGLRIGIVAQEEEFAASSTVNSVLGSAVDDASVGERERDALVASMIARMEFTVPDAQTETLSGGWRKRLAIARELIRKPDVLLLDEPTNHLDLEAILWLEQLLREAPFAFLLVSHDRQFLENVTNRMIELNPAFPGGYLRVEGNYSELLARKEALLAAQAHQEVAMANRVRREIAWLRRGPPARTTKAQFRIDDAHRQIADLAEIRTRNVSGRTTEIDFQSTGRGTRELLVAHEIGKSMGGRRLFDRLNLVLSPGAKLGLIGPNGSGKSSLIRLLTGEWEPDSGSIRRAGNLRIVVFDQNREELDPAISLRRTLSPAGDTVNYRSGSIHVASWAKRFLFPADQLERPIGTMSGGEKARVLIARLMLRPADLLILDEPTNDLDIPTLEILEESLQEFTGALVLVTHDRFLLDSVATNVLALDGRGVHAFLADYSQWEEKRREEQAHRQRAEREKARAATKAPAIATTALRLTATERRELREMESRIMEAEHKAAELESRLAMPEVASDAATLQECWSELERARERISALYVRWEELEGRV